MEGVLYVIIGHWEQATILKNEMPLEVGVSLDSLTLGASYFRTDGRALRHYPTQRHFKYEVLKGSFFEKMKAPPQSPDGRIKVQTKDRT